MPKNNRDRMSLVRITAGPGLDKIESKYRKQGAYEALPYANDTPYRLIAEGILPDRDGPANADGIYRNPLVLCESAHTTTIGSTRLCSKLEEYLQKMSRENPIDILSITSYISGHKLIAVFLIRVYGQTRLPQFEDLYTFLGEAHEEEAPEENTLEKGQNITRDPGAADLVDKEMLTAQQTALYQSTKEKPFLNSVERYVPRTARRDAERIPVYNLMARDQQTSTILSYEKFTAIFRETMQYISSVEKDAYYDLLRGHGSEEAFMQVIRAYIMRVFVQERKTLPLEDVPALIAKIRRALFDLYIIQDLIDDPDITDVKITDPYSVRVRIKGKAYLSNITFIDADDYIRFVNGIYIRNNIDYTVPAQTFTDEKDDQYILRFSITAPYITPSNFPIIHIRKVSRRKLMSEDLIRAGMMDEKIRDYLIDCGKFSRGVVFAGPPGSGKTTLLNWYLEDAYEDSAEILVIQENDELFSSRKGVMFEHVVNNPTNGNRRCTLEDLGQMALVAGANVFVIGEAKGGEISAAITLSNSGCRTAISIHSPSADETLDKMADLAMRGYATSYDQAKRMLKSFQTIIYLQDFKVMEISEIVGYDEEKKDMVYRYVYRREND